MGLKRKTAQVGEKFKIITRELQAEVMLATKELMSERELTDRWAEVIDVDDVVKKILAKKQDTLISFDGRKT